MDNKNSSDSKDYDKKVQVKTYRYQIKNTLKHDLKNLFKNEACLPKSDKSVGYETKDYTTGDYQIAICQDGKFAVTFDTGNEIVADFKIDDDFTIKNFYKSDKSSFFNHNEEIEKSNSNEDEKREPFKWSFDISNMHKKDWKSFILVAISRINVDEDMKKYDKKPSKHETEDENTEISVTVLDNKVTDQNKKGIAVYRVEVEEKESRGENLDDIKDSEDENKEGIAINRIEYETRLGSNNT
ncbi:hypothetical protein RhiirA4_426078 [Rhizophagus irregularis]|uniref:Uncharacterized protein n=1 Tax=Rhizophagus irregularis TaxID=588596 RepID=A0A2I1H3R5_9GLOM|nr:hypothetical protein RhiirA4_426078 [Rhizophagus irregularis]